MVFEKNFRIKTIVKNHLSWTWVIRRLSINLYSFDIY